MATLKFLKTRIHSIKSTQKITSAMKLVASSHFKKAEARLNNAAPHTALLDHIFQTVKQTAEDILHPYCIPATSSTEQQHLLIIVSGNRGLCGGYNLNVSRKANAIIENLLKTGQKLSLVTFGARALAGLPQKYRPLVTQHWTDKQYDTSQKVNVILDKIAESLETRAFQHCSIVYTSFRSIMNAAVIHHPLFPYASNILLNSKKYQARAENNSSFQTFEVEPRGEKLVSLLWKEHLKAQIYFAICEGLSSEHSARMLAMDNAHKNAKEMLVKLELLYNKTRQSIITKELIEIIAGSESI